MAQKAEARNPVKLVVACGICLISAAILLGMIVARPAARRAEEADALQAKWDRIQSNPGSSFGDTKSYKTLAEDICAINHDRPLYAAQLAVIKDIVPETIRLTQIGLSYVTEEAPSSSDLPAPAGTSDKPIRRSPPKSRNHLSLVLSGQAESARPEIEVDKFIWNMRAYPALIDTVDEVRLRSIARTAASTDGTEKKVAAAIFSIECQYKSQK
jgi:hypothetical protein